VLVTVPDRWPGSDLVQFEAALKQAIGRARIRTLLADADFDAEWVHEQVRCHGIRTIIPAERGRPTTKPPAGHWRAVHEAVVQPAPIEIRAKVAGRDSQQHDQTAFGLRPAGAEVLEPGSRDCPQSHNT
jgi:hypothetical protein